MKAKIIVDTSIWIEYLLRPHSREKKEIDSLLDNNQVALMGIVLAELLQGTKDQKEFQLLKSTLEALPFYETSLNIWVKTGEIAYSLRKKGITIPLSDCLIAALALQNGCEIYTLDPYFKQIEKVKLYQPQF